MNRGRKVIFTDEPVITSENIISVLQKAMPDFISIASECDYLLKFEAGEQPLQRKKEKQYRKDIDFKDVDNVANEVTEFKLGFNWGNPITFVQRGEKDSGTASEPEAIALLNECYETDGNKSKTQQLARFIEITGIGYTFVDINTDYVDGDSYFNVNVLDPRWAFVIRSSRYTDHRIMLGVSLRKDDLGNFYMTCFTPHERFEILNLAKIVNSKTVKETDTSRAWKDTDRWKETERSGELNPLGVIPIIEYQRSHDRMGCFERQIDELNCLNLLISDFVNDVDQNTNAIWHGNDIEFPKTEDGDDIKPETNDWILTFTTQDGKTPFVKPLSVEYNYAGILEMILSRRSLILQKCNVPQRNDNSGGSTGVAMSDATGWSAAETAACKEQNIIEVCKMNEVRAVLQAIKASSYVPQDSPLLKLRYSDTQVNIKRQKTYELTVKVNAICAVLAKGFTLKDTIKAIPLFEDDNQVIVDSGEGVAKYQETNVFRTDTTSGAEETEEKRPFADLSDQEGNSPNIGSMNTDNNSDGE
jgi:SPP1 family phage portal protein